MSRKIPVIKTGASSHTDNNGEVLREQLGLEQMKRMSPFSDEREMPLAGALLCHVMLLNSVLERTANRFAEDHGLTFPQWMALGSIGHGGEEGVRHSELGQRLMLSKAPITGLIDRLERAGYVQRKTDPKDRRASRVVITEEGCAVWEQVRGALEERGNESCSCITEEEQQNTLSMLSRLLESTASADPSLNYSMDCPAQAAFAVKNAEKSKGRTL